MATREPSTARIPTTRSSVSTGIAFSFQKAYDGQNQFNFPGAAQGYETHGSSTSFDVNAGVYYEDYPTLNVALGRSFSNYEVLGSAGNGEADGRMFSATSSYSLAGFNLTGGYNNTRTGNSLPVVAGFNLADKVNAYQHSYHVAANRRLLDWAHWGAGYSRGHVNSDYVQNPASGSFQVVDSVLSMNPVQKLSMNVHVDYTDNFSAQVLSGIVGGSKSSSTNNPLTLESISNYLTYGTDASYSLMRNLVVQGRVDHREQSSSFSKEGASSNVATTSTGYSHTLLGGNIGGSYGVSWYKTNQNQGAVGQSLSGSYNRSLLGWNTGVGAHYAENVATALVGYTSSGYGMNASVGHSLWRGWNFSMGGNMGRSQTNGLGDSRAFASSYSGSISAPRFSVSGTYGRNYGNSLPFGNGGGGGVLPGTIFFQGNSWGVGFGTTPIRHLRISATYSHMQYHSDNVNTLTESLTNRFESKTEYRWRQMTFNGGYAYLSQGIGATFKTPDKVNVFYVGVTRHFDIF